jgi:hypothetical protein
VSDPARQVHGWDQDRCWSGAKKRRKPVRCWFSGKKVLSCEQESSKWNVKAKIDPVFLEVES